MSVPLKNIKNSTDDLIRQLEQFSTTLSNMSEIKNKHVNKTTNMNEKIAGKKGTWRDTSNQNWICSLRK
jgi:hypothetical protein